jgi:hypothetical protein
LTLTNSYIKFVTTMNVERIFPENQAGDTATPNREHAASFRVPVPHEIEAATGGESKSKRNRKKRKKQLNAAVGQQPAASDTDTQKPQAPEFKNGEFTVWQRPDQTPENQKSAKIGEKVLDVAEQDRADDPARAPLPELEYRQQPMIQHQAGEVEPGKKLTDSDVNDESHQKHHDHLTVEQPEEPQLVSQTDLQSTPQQERPSVDDVSAATESNNGGLIDIFEQPYQPMPPAQEPDAMSYRRRFWNEQPAEAVNDPNRPPDGLPAVHNYDMPQYEAMASEPRHAERPQRYEAPAAVPQARYESDTPPGYQRSTADVSRAAWTGVLAGWWYGRRGKRKAVEQARAQGVKQGIASVSSQPMANERRRTAEPNYPRRLEAEPIHTMSAPEGTRAVVQPLFVETGVRRESAPSAIAAIAVFERLVSRRFDRPPLSPAVRLVAARAAESVVARPSLEAIRTPAAEHSLNKRELMKVAKDIKIDGVPVKEIYNAKRIDEAGLRAVVETYLRGGDVRQQLIEEITVKEQSFERDPVFRDHMLNADRERRARSNGSSDNSSGSGGRLQSVGRALGSMAATTENSARSAGRAIASGAKTAQRDLIDNSNTTDWLSITAVVVLYSIILILLLN